MGVEDDPVSPISGKCLSTLVIFSSCEMFFELTPIPIQMVARALVV
jgi:hypothetical protein